MSKVQKKKSAQPWIQRRWRRKENIAACCNTTLKTEKAFSLKGWEINGNCYSLALPDECLKTVCPIVHQKLLWITKITDNDQNYKFMRLPTGVRSLKVNQLSLLQLGTARWVLENCLPYSSTKVTLNY